jgi:hypothetical protein
MPSPMGIRVVPRIGDELKVIDKKKIRNLCNT